MTSRSWQFRATEEIKLGKNESNSEYSSFLPQEIMEFLDKLSIYMIHLPFCPQQALRWFYMNIIAGDFLVAI